MRGYHSVSLPVLTLILVLVLAGTELIGFLAAGAVPHVHTQREDNVDDTLMV